MNDGGPAFPVGNHPLLIGMSLRDWYAGMALQGMLAGITQFHSAPDMKDIIINRPNDISELAYLYADAMLEERANNENQK